MRDPAANAPAKRRFQAEIYRDLDRKLKNSRWNSGASEAHGLLSGLACRGVSGEQLRGKAWLLQLSEQADLDLIEGMYGLILRELHSEGFEFTLLLPDADDAEDALSRAQQTESLADWCGGFIQGFLHDGEESLAGLSVAVREAVDDIIEISRVQSPAAGKDETAAEQTERQLSEVEEYLRVATQVIFDELNPGGAEQNH